MTNRRKFLIGVGSLAAGSAAAISTGAYSEAEMVREADINVVNDDSGILALVPAVDSDVVRLTDNGELTIDFDPTGDGTGININSAYRVGSLYKTNIENLDDFTSSYTDAGVEYGLSPYDDPAFRIENNDTEPHDVQVSYEVDDPGNLNPNGTRMAINGITGGNPQDSAARGRMSISNDNPNNEWTVSVEPGEYIGVSILLDTQRSGASTDEDISGTLNVNVT